jgi:hypothetical protein
VGDIADDELAFDAKIERGAHDLVQFLDRLRRETVATATAIGRE